MQTTFATELASVRNHNERAVYNAVAEHADHYPGLAEDPRLLADVACVALNRLPARYIRHEADYAFYLGDHAREDGERQLQEAVEFAFGFVQARIAMGARG